MPEIPATLPLVTDYIALPFSRNNGIRRTFNMEAEYLTPQEVVRRLQVKASTVRRWIYIGALEAETIQQGRRNRHRIKVAVIEAIERCDPVRHCKLV